MSGVEYIVKYLRTIYILLFLPIFLLDCWVFIDLY